MAGDSTERATSRPPGSFATSFETWTALAAFALLVAILLGTLPRIIHW